MRLRIAEIDEDTVTQTAQRDAADWGADVVRRKRSLRERQSCAGSRLPRTSIRRSALI
jgi:hypothetical protein